MVNKNQKWLEGLNKKIKIDDYIYNCYDDSNNEFTDVVCFELSESIKEIALKKNLKMFIFNTSPKQNLKIFLDKFNYIDKKKTNINDLKKIKFYQRNDLMYLYFNNFFKMLFVFPLLNENNVYSYNFCIIADEKFDLNLVFKNNYNLINIESVKEVYNYNIDFWVLENLFNKRSLIDNSMFSGNKSKKWMYKYIDPNDFEENLKKNSDYIDDYSLNHKKYLNEESKISEPLFDQHFYALCCFEKLCTHFYCVDKFYYKQINNVGWTYCYVNTFNLNKSFVTKFNKNNDSVLYNVKENTIINQEYDIFHLYDIYSDFGIACANFNEDYILNDEIDFKNLPEITEEKWTYLSNL